MLLYETKVLYHSGDRPESLGVISPQAALDLSTELGEGARVYQYSGALLVGEYWDGAAWQSRSK